MVQLLSFVNLMSTNKKGLINYFTLVRIKPFTILLVLWIKWAQEKKLTFSTLAKFLLSNPEEQEFSQTLSMIFHLKHNRKHILSPFWSSQPDTVSNQPAGGTEGPSSGILGSTVSVKRQSIFTYFTQWLSQTLCL